MASEEDDSFDSDFDFDFDFDFENVRNNISCS